MKTKTLVAFATLCITCFFRPTQANGQPAFGLGVGYNFGAGGSRLGYSENNMWDYTHTPTTNTSTDKGVYGSWGQGFDVDGWFEDMLCECFGIGAELSYGHGRKFKYQDNDTYTYPSYTQTSVENYTGGLNTFSLTPYMKVQCCEYFGIMPYGRIGLDINLMNSMKQVYDRTETSPSGTDVYKEEAKLKGKLNLGLDAAAGFRYGLGGGLNLYGELDYRTSSFMEDKWTLTKYSVNGVDQLGSLNTSQKETEFSKSYSSSASTSTGSPSQALADKYPSSYFGLRVGIAYDLRGSSPKAQQPK